MKEAVVITFILGVIAFILAIIQVWIVFNTNERLTKQSMHLANMSFTNGVIGILIITCSLFVGLSMEGSNIPKSIKLIIPATENISKDSTAPSYMIAYIIDNQLIIKYDSAMEDVDD